MSSSRWIGATLAALALALTAPRAAEARPILGPCTTGSDDVPIAACGACLVRSAACVDPCAGAPCPSRQPCSAGGRSVADPWAGVSCPGGTACAMGRRGRATGRRSRLGLAALPRRLRSGAR